MRKHFTTYLMNDVGIDCMDGIKHKYDELAAYLEGFIDNDPRLKAMVLSKLEEACMLSVKAYSSKYPEKEFGR